MTLDAELHYLLLRAFNNSNRRILKGLEGSGLLPGQPKILEYLGEHDGSMAKELCAGCTLDKSTVTSLLARMEERGLIVRRVEERDRRSAHVWLTDVGRAKLAETKRVCAQVDALATRGLDAESRDRLAAALRTVIANFEQEGEEAHRG